LYANTKAEIIKAIQRETGIPPKEASKASDIVLTAIKDILADTGNLILRCHIDSLKIRWKG